MSQSSEDQDPKIHRYEQRIQELERELAYNERRQRRESRENRQTAPKQQPSTRKKTVRVIRNVCLLVFLLALSVGAFVLGRLSLRPQFNSYVSKISSTSQEPPKSPDEVLQQLLTAAQKQDSQHILSLLHPDHLDRNNYKIAHLIKEWPGIATKVKEIKVVGIEESAEINFSLVLKDGTIKFEEIGIKKHQGQWLITNLCSF